MKIAVLGGGVAGIAAAFRLSARGVDFRVYESNPQIGGLCRSYERDGYTFDMAGVHVMHSRSNRTLNFMLSFLGDNVTQSARTARIYHDGTWIRFPFSSGVNDLPTKEYLFCLASYLTAFLRRNVLCAGPGSYREWLLLRYGRRASRIHYLPYSQKLYKYPLDNLSFDWIKDFVPPPKFLNLPFLSRMSKTPAEVSIIYHPKRGGIQAFINGMSSTFMKHILKETPVVRIEKVSNVFYVNGERYDGVISTIPLPEVVHLIRGLDQAIINNAMCLRYLSLCTLLVGTTLGPDYADSWRYIPSRSASPLHRITWMNNIGSQNDSVTKFSLVGEMTIPGGEPCYMTDELIDTCLTSLVNLKMLNLQDIKFVETRTFKYAYILGDTSYHRRVSLVRDGLQEYGIRLLGRFGEFKHLNVDHIINASENVVNRVLSRGAT